MKRTIVVVYPDGCVLRVLQDDRFTREWFRRVCETIRKNTPGVRIWEEFS